MTQSLGHPAPGEHRQRTGLLILVANIVDRLLPFGIGLTAARAKPEINCLARSAYRKPACDATFDAW